MEDILSRLISLEENDKEKSKEFFSLEKNQVALQRDILSGEREKFALKERMDAMREEMAKMKQKIGYLEEEEIPRLNRKNENLSQENENLRRKFTETSSVISGMKKIEGQVNELIAIRRVLNRVLVEAHTAKDKQAKVDIIPQLQSKIDKLTGLLQSNTDHVDDRIKKQERSLKAMDTKLGVIAEMDRKITSLSGPVDSSNDENEKQIKFLTKKVDILPQLQGKIDMLTGLVQSRTDHDDDKIKKQECSLKTIDSQVKDLLLRANKTERFFANLSQSVTCVSLEPTAGLKLGQRIRLNKCVMAPTNNGYFDVSNCILSPKEDGIYSVCVNFVQAGKGQIMLNGLIGNKSKLLRNPAPSADVNEHYFGKTIFNDHFISTLLLFKLKKDDSFLLNAALIEGNAKIHFCILFFWRVSDLP